MNIKIYKKIILISIILIEIFSLAVSPAMALFGGGSIKLPTANQVAGELEDRYHLNLGTMQNFSEGFNVSQSKGSPPEVIVTFDPPNPKPGDKVTATATPLYFSTPEESMYYTWYLQHNNPELGYDCTFNMEGINGSPACDNDEDGMITAWDWAIEAMRIVASGGYDPAINTSGGYDGEKRTDKLPEGDADTYEATMGGDGNENDKGEYFCYVHDFKTGINYELVGEEAELLDFEPVFEGCSRSNVRCLSTFTEVCTYEEIENEGEYAYEEIAGAGLGSFGSAMGPFFTAKACTDTKAIPDCIPNNADGEGSVVCPIGSEPVCINLPSVAIDPKCTFLEEHGNTPCSGVGSPVGSCLVPPKEEEGIKFCGHYFAHYGDGSACDGGFSDTEERYWGTDIYDTNTANIGLNDQANTCGLGIKSFTWNYLEGDEISVLVEGESMIPTPQDDSSMMIMWAYPKNKCPIEGNRKGSYTINVKGRPVNIPTAMKIVQFECVPKNLMNPSIGGNAENLEVFLTYEPDTPINDGAGNGTGDRVILQSTTTNSGGDRSQTYYRWKIKKLKLKEAFGVREEFWEDITGPLWDNFDDVMQFSNLEGIDEADFSFSLNIPKGDIHDSIFNSDGVGYLRVYANVEEHFDADITREGKSDVIIRIISGSTQIKSYVASATGGSLSFSREICDGETICYVAKNEIIGVESESGLVNYDWTLNGNPLECDTEMGGSACNDTKQTNTTFFPVAGDVGDILMLKLTANDTEHRGGKGETIHLSKAYQIVEPYVELEPGAGASRKDLGSYKDLDGGGASASSTNVFEGSGAMGVNAVFHPSFIEDKSTVNWMVDGEDAGTGNSVTVSGAKEPGEAYNVYASAVYNQDDENDEIRKALKKFWKITQTDSIEKLMTRSVQLEVSTGAVASGPDTPKAIMASLIHNLPTQVMFLFRILLTILVIVFTLNLVFSFAVSPPRGQR